MGDEATDVDVKGVDSHTEHDNDEEQNRGHPQNEDTDHSNNTGEAEHDEMGEEDNESEQNMEEEHVEMGEEDNESEQNVEAQEVEDLEISYIDTMLDDRYQRDPKPRKILKALRKGKKKSRLIALHDCENRGGYLWYQKRLYIPDHDLLKLQLI